MRNVRLKMTEKSWGPPFFFSLLANQWIFFGVYQMEISTGKRLKSRKEKIGKVTLPPQEKFPCYAPGSSPLTTQSQITIIFFPPFIYAVNMYCFADICSAANPCLHEGKCYRDTTAEIGYTCNCPQGFGGENCQGRPTVWSKYESRKVALNIDFSHYWR